ncbi:InlB B-repeat-containing protein [uncultured Fibrobacter sp.]|uniref:InlB B-repeat-containing protein n=1 Tax=uncultured Fibrobacter sp. TaxID=261512 RepID=UPI0025E2797E|nr:InlB B-repeat-containing protein [uncultured Fibrobacter sp.]
MKNIKIFAFLAIFLLSAAVSSAWAWKGSGTSDAPYQITSAADLTQLATDVNGGESYSNMYFKQTADIMLSGEWTPIGTESKPFKGHYDGGGFAIRGLRVTGNYKHAGLFGYISSDRYHGSQIFIELKNINIVDCVIDVGTVESSVAGGIAGETGPVHITGNRVRGSITAYGNTGGLIGIIRSNATVSNNFVDVTVSGTGNQYNQYMHPEVCLMVSVSGGSSGGSGNYYHDNGGNVSVSLNTNITATPVYSVTTSVAGLTISDANVTLDGVKYYETGKMVTFGFSGFGSVVYFVNGERIEGNSVIVGQEDLTVQTDIIPYIDENGKTQIREPGEYTVLTEDNKPNEDGVINLNGGWYVVQGKVKYASQVKFSGEAHLILADGAEMVIESESMYGIYALNNLTIYGQSGQGGILNAAANGKSGYGIYSRDGNITIIGGTVTATSTNGPGIYGYNGVTISGGSVEAVGRYGILGSKGVTISGGRVTATGTGFYGIHSSGNITLGWTNSTDFIKASSYSLGDNEKHVSIVEGKSFKDEKGIVYSGTLTGEQLSAIKGKELESCYAVTFDAQNGDDPIMLLTTFDENGVAHVKKPNDPIRSGFTFEGWFTAKDGNTEFDFSAAITGNTTAYAKWSVPYIDENGAPKSVTDYTVLTEDNKPNENGIINLNGGWYVVLGEVKYSNQVKFSGEAHLILVDGAEMVIESESMYGIYASNNLTIYGQNEQRGILKVTATGTNGSGIYSRGNITIIGGRVTASGSSCGIYGSKRVTIIGGSVEATGEYGIYSFNGNVTLGWTNSTDSIKASSYYSYKGSVQIAEGKSFKDENGNVYRGTLTKGQVSDLKGQKLEPFEGKSVSFVDNFSGASDVFAEIAVDGEGHVSAPSKHPFHSGYAFVGWFAAPDGNTEFDFTKAVTENTAAYAKWKENAHVEYIDENGTPKSVTDFIVLTEDNKPNENGIINLPGGWYVVQGKVEYTNQVKFSGDAHLILADGAKLEIETKGESEHGIYASKNLTIYGQNEQRGILKVTATGHNGYCIYSFFGGITINGGTVEATGGNNGIYSSNGNITINGGTVEATGYDGDGIRSSYGNITLGWTNSTDFIKASSYSLGDNEKHVSIAEGKSFKDENGNMYSGTLSAGQFASLKGQKLEPFEGVSVSFVDNFSGASEVIAEIAVDREGHVSAPSKPPFHSGYAFIGWFTTTDGNTEFDFTKAVTENTAAYAKWKENAHVEYIDENGTPKSVTDFIVLTEDNKPNENGIINLPGGWYVVQGEVKYSNQVMFSGEAHLILADGAEMVIKSETYGIQADKNLTIYGQSKQSDQSGTLKVTATGSGIYSRGNITIIGGSVTATGLSYGILGSKGVTISGGSVTATGKNGDGIYSYNGGVTISGGSVKATSKSGSGINSSSGKITISGGKVEASGSIYSYNGNITLGWTNSTDYIKSSYYSYKGSVQIAEGKSFKDENGNVYSGTINPVSDIAGKTLVPAKPFPDNMVIADIPDQIYTGDSICPMADVTMPAGVDPLVKGEDYKVVCKENLNAGTATLSVQGVGIYYGEIKKTFTIAKASLTITAKDKTIAYGDEPANDGVKYSGFVGEENEAVLGGELSYSYNYQKLDKVGEYTITPSGLTASNYEITYAAGTLTVEIAAVSVEAPVAKEKLVYSGKSQELVTAGKTNFGTLLYSLDGEKYSAEIPTATDAKTYTVYYKVAESDNWNAFEAKTIEVVIAKAPLTITAKDKTIAYGDEPANDGVEYSGFIGEENASVLGGKLTYSYDYKKLDKVGKYTITPSGLTASNYEISFVAGALNVEPKAMHYAAVQVLEDENGKRAEIDGEYGESDGIVITEPLEVASVEFSRDFSTQGYSTIVFPFDVNTSKLSGVDSVLSFARIVKEQSEMAVGMKVVWEASASHVDLKANTPYMVKMTGAKLGIDGGVTLLPTEAAVTKSDAQNDGWEFRGTYAYKSWQEGDEDLCRVYGFAGGSNDEVSEGDFVKFTAGASLRPLRAYLINTNRTCGAPKMARAYGDYVLGAKSSIDDLPESMKVVIVGEDGHTTVIGHFNTRTGEFMTGTSVRKFDLKGRAVRGTPSARGAYYGKKVKK